VSKPAEEEFDKVIMSPGCEENEPGFVEP